MYYISAPPAIYRDLIILGPRVATGKELWTQDLYAHAMAVPMTYEGRGGYLY